MDSDGKLTDAYITRNQFISQKSVLLLFSLQYQIKINFAFNDFLLNNVLFLPLTTFFQGSFIKKCFYFIIFKNQFLIIICLFSLSSFVYTHRVSFFNILYICFSIFPLVEFPHGIRQDELLLVIRFSLVLAKRIPQPCVHISLLPIPVHFLQNKQMQLLNYFQKQNYINFYTLTSLS